MNCESFMGMLSSYPDALEGPRVAEAMREHAAECPDCARRLSRQETLLADLAALAETPEAPEAFRVGWRAAVRGCAAAPRRRLGAWAIAGAAALCLVAGTALTREGILFPETPEADPIAYTAESSYAYEEDALVKAEARFASSETGAGAPLGGVVADRAMPDAPTAVTLHSASLRIETEWFDRDMAALEALLADSGGWMAYRSVYGSAPAQPGGTGRDATMTLRVPMESLEAFLSGISAIGRVTGSERETRDITENYYDTAARLAMYEAQRDRLVELLASAEDLTDILDMESRMNDLQYTIESLQGTLGAWDAKARDATVQVSLREVGRGETEVPETLGARIFSGLKRSVVGVWAFLQDMAVFMGMALPYAAVPGVVLAGIFIVRKRKKAKAGREAS